METERYLEEKARAEGFTYGPDQGRDLFIRRDGKYYYPVAGKVAIEFDKETGHVSKAEILETMAIEGKPSDTAFGWDPVEGAEPISRRELEPTPVGLRPSWL